MCLGGNCITIPRHNVFIVEYVKYDTTGGYNIFIDNQLIQKTTLARVVFRNTSCDHFQSYPFVCSLGFTLGFHQITP